MRKIQTKAYDTQHPLPHIKSELIELSRTILDAGKIIRCMTPDAINEENPTFRDIAMRLDVISARYAYNLVGMTAVFACETALDALTPCEPQRLLAVRTISEFGGLRPAYGLRQENTTIHNADYPDLYVRSLAYDQETGQRVSVWAPTEHLQELVFYPSGEELRN